MLRMQQDKSAIINQYRESKRKIHLSIVIFVFFAVLGIVASVKYYKPGFIRVTVGKVDYTIKNQNNDVLPNANSSNVSINIVSQDGGNDTIIDASKIESVSNNTLKIDEMIVKMLSKDKSSYYVLTGKEGFVKDKDDINIPGQAKIIDQDGNIITLNALHAKISTKKAYGNNPVGFVVRNDVEYHISGDKMNLDHEAKIVHIQENVRIDMINSHNDIAGYATAKDMVIDYNQKTIILTDKVHIYKEDGYIISDKVVIIFAKNHENKNDISFINFSGSVHLHDDEKDVYSNNAIFDSKQNQIEFINDVKLNEGEKTLIGEKFIYNAISQKGYIIAGAKTGNKIEFTSK
jgi:lipopolysaccharide export system protein LptA